MSNIQLFLSLAGFLAAIFTWFRFDINKRFDEQRASIDKRFDGVDKRFDDLNTSVHKRIDDQNYASTTRPHS